ncbi:hypothetical protein Dimus_034104 [Dionaea muscipula]
MTKASDSWMLKMICKLINLNSFYNFVFFTLGLSLGLTIGFHGPKTSPLMISTNIFSPFFLSNTSSSSSSSSSPSLLRPPISASSLPAQPSQGLLLPNPSSQLVSEYCMNGVSLEVGNLSSLFHNMSDEELLRRASVGSNNLLVQNQGCSLMVPKLAFMFLTKGPMPLGPLWELFFKGHQGLYSIYLHTHPSYNDEALPRDSVFYRRRIPSQPVEWGTISMIDAERRLLANALLDSSNQRFILLSESCIPLFNFTTIYAYLINSKLSFLGSFDDPRNTGRGRYNPRMQPDINITDWRKGSQWFEARRDLALHIVSDDKYYSIFKEHCHPPCYIDEHYLPTMVNIKFQGSSANRSITWVNWSRAGPHPDKLGWGDVTEEFLNRIRFGSNCTYNGSLITSHCFLFARKFVPSALEKLIILAPLVLGFGP